MRKLVSLAALAATSTLLVACGGSAFEGTTTGSNGTGNGTGTGTGTTPTTTYAMGNGSGTSFQSGKIAITTASLSAGGSTSMSASIVQTTTGQAAATLYTGGSVTVTFNSPCISQGLATISASGTNTAGSTANTVVTTTGNVSATYTAKGCNGSDAVTASATVASTNLTATGTVTVAPGTIGSISFISATPTAITLKGVGSSSGSSTSTLIFKVLDTSGGPSVGATVNFALTTEVGGITIVPMTAQSDANGEVQTIVNGGTVATTVRVTASTVANGNTISTESNALTVSTGIPTSANVSLAVKCQNVEAWNIDGVTVPVTVSMTDRFSNPVPDGTTANFQTTLGGIQASCQTGNPTSGSGACTVNWISKAPYTVNGNPQSTSGNANTRAAYCTNSIGTGLGLCNGTTNGRSAILVTAIGEESFKDATGNGYFNPADTVAWNATDADNNFTSGTNSGQPKPWQDTSEQFLNEWELFDTYGTPTYVLGEPFFDFNNNNLRDGPDNMVESALCQGPLCNTSGASVGIGASNIIILSGSNALLNVLSAPTQNGSGAYVIGSGGTFTVDIFDERLQQMPATTTVTASISTGSTIVITSPQPAAWPCSTAPPTVNGSNQLIAGQTFSFSLADGTGGTQVGGSLYITVKTPAGLITTFSFPIAP